jgi:hypothetical protein
MSFFSALFTFLFRPKMTYASELKRYYGRMNEAQKASENKRKDLFTLEV